MLAQLQANWQETLRIAAMVVIGLSVLTVLVALIMTVLDDD